MLTIEALYLHTTVLIVKNIHSFVASFEVLMHTAKAFIETISCSLPISAKLLGSVRINLL